MSTVRFGLACDRCSVEFRDYDTGDIRTCEECAVDLCALCAAATRHVKGREADLDQQPTWREVEGMPIADAIADAAQLRLFVEDAYAFRFDRPLDPRYYITRKALGDAEYYGFSENPRPAFSAAFAAVPGLR